MKKTLALLMIALCAVSCATRPAKNSSMEKHLSEITGSPPSTLPYTKTVVVVAVPDQPDWGKIPESLVATTVLSRESRATGVGVPLAMQAASNGKKLFLRIRWSDRTPHISPDWNKEEKLSLSWNVNSQGFSNQGCGAACHFWPPDYAYGRVPGMWLQQGEIVDNWTWEAASASSKIVKHWNLGGMPGLIYRAAIPPAVKPHVLRSGYKESPTLASLDGDSAYENGEWTVLISRNLKSSSKKEVQFNPGERLNYVFGAAVFPGSLYHNYSSVLTLRFQSPVKN